MADYIVNTFENRLELSNEAERFMDDYARLYNGIKHKYYARTKKERGGEKSRKEFLVDLGNPFAYRVFKGIEETISGLEKSQLTNRKNYLANAECKLDTLNKTIKKLENKKKAKILNASKKEQSILIKKIEKRERLKNKIHELKQDKDSHICFGGSKLLKKRHECITQEEIDQWHKEWNFKRNSEFFLVGSHDENNGNSNCQITHNDKNFDISLAVPFTLRERYGERVSLENIIFKYGNNHIQKAIAINHIAKLSRSEKDKLERKAKKNGIDPSTLNIKAESGSPLSYRFKKDKDGWRVFINVRVPRTKIITNKKNGAIGVDLNADHLAVVEVDKHGNYLNKWTFYLPLTTKSSHQREAIIGDEVKKVVQLAIDKKKPIVIEDLDFAKKKKMLHKENPKYARMLSAFAYKKVKDFFEGRCHRSGVELLKRNPAYTSVLGKLKYKERFGLSAHHSAAMVIARRGLNLKEKLPSKLYQVKEDQCLTLSPPARIGKSAMADYRKFFSWLGRLRAIDSVMHFGKAKALLKAKHTLHTSMSGVTTPLSTTAL